MPWWPLTSPAPPANPPGAIAAFGPQTSEPSGFIGRASIAPSTTRVVEERSATACWPTSLSVVPAGTVRERNVKTAMFWSVCRYAMFACTSRFAGLPVLAGRRTTPPAVISPVSTSMTVSPGAGPPSPASPVSNPASSWTVSTKSFRPVPSRSDAGMPALGVNVRQVPGVPSQEGGGPFCPESFAEPPPSEPAPAPSGPPLVAPSSPGPASLLSAIVPLPRPRMALHPARRASPPATTAARAITTTPAARRCRARSRG